MLRAAAAEVTAQQAGARLAAAAAGSLSGVFAVNKPPGISCTGLLDYFKRNVGHGRECVPFAEHFARERGLRRSGHKILRRKCAIQLRVGHGGTLDVEAAGVLVIGINNACKQLTTYLAGEKSYLATARLGVATDSYDAEGKITAVGGAATVTGEALQAAIPRFVGDIMQAPPVYSALRVNGKRLYEYARSGEPVPLDIKQRQVNVKGIRLLHFAHPATGQQLGTRVALPAQYDDYYTSGRYAGGSNDTAGELQVGAAMAPFANCPALPQFQILIQSGGGVYVRSLVHDLGVAVGSHATMTSLVRMAQGPFRLGRDTISVDDLPYIDRIVDAMRHTSAAIARNSLAATQNAPETRAVE
ncbi:pseudouridine synthase pus4 [Coemansia spiralis]|nr:pseudouridine synthase pus4 [Coemansia spiralis]